MAYSASMIKSVQRGTVTVSNLSYASTATISAVDTSKSFISWLNGTVAYQSKYKMVLTNSTTITTTTIVLPGDALGVASFVVVEYY